MWVERNPTKKWLRPLSSMLIFLLAANMVSMPGIFPNREVHAAGGCPGSVCTGLTSWVDAGSHGFQMAKVLQG